MHDAIASDALRVSEPSLKDNLAFTLEQAGQLSGIGRSALYIAVREGRLEARKCGRRTVVLIPAFAQSERALRRVASHVMAA